MIILTYLQGGGRGFTEPVRTRIVIGCEDHARDIQYRLSGHHMHAGWEKVMVPPARDDAEIARALKLVKLAMGDQQ